MSDHDTDHDSGVALSSLSSSPLSPSTHLRSLSEEAVAATAVRHVKCTSLTASPGQTYTLGRRVARGLIWSTYGIMDHHSQSSPATPLVAKIHHKPAELPIRTANSSMSLGETDDDHVTWAEQDAFRQMENEVKLLSGPLKQPGLGFVVPMISFHRNASLGVRGDTSCAAAVEADSERVIAMIMPDAGEPCTFDLAQLSRDEKTELQRHYSILHAHRIVHGDAHPRNWLRVRPGCQEDEMTIRLIDWGNARVVPEGDEIGEQLLTYEAEYLAKALLTDDMDLLPVM